ncbi:methyltransferase [Pseudoneobacillus sp. C159]
MKEQDYDEKLNIHTIEEQQGFHRSFHYHRYEPTPYSALEQLFLQYGFNSNDHVVDFGCGKGRLNFFIHHQFKASVVGIEMNEEFYLQAIDNQRSYMKKMKEIDGKISFYCCLAENYQINPVDNRFYFFNPFSVQIFMNVLNNIMRSVEQYKREIDVILYYPSEDYIYYLENQTSFELVKEVQLEGLYEHNTNERFLIYRLP